MAPQDFDIESLSAYLHLDRAKVQKLANRGKLPGRKVGSQWRFSQAEIHHWLEERIGLSGSEELIRVEDVLEKSADVQPGGFVSLTDMLPLEAVEVPLAARTRNSAIHSMVQVAARTGWLWDPAKMEEAIRQREDLYSTALENGVALLHPRRPMAGILERAFVALGRTNRGIPFGSSRGILTDTFFLICSVEDGGHLQTLARIGRLLGEPDFLDQLREASDAQSTYELIAEREQALLE
jgi:PTS system nitrogen regulatory IIA component